MNSGQNVGLSEVTYSISLTPDHEQDSEPVDVKSNIARRLNTFMQSFDSLNLSNNSRRVYESRTKQFLKFVISLPDAEFGYVNDEQAFVDMYSAFIFELQTARFAQQATISNYNRFGKMFAEFCGWSRDAVPNIVRTASARKLGSLEVQLYINTLEKFGSSRNKAMIHLLLLEELKIEEVLTLKIEDVVVMDGCLVTIRKGKNGLVEACMSEIAAHSITQWIRERLAETHGQKGLFLFPGANNGPISKAASDFAMRKYGWRCGIVASVRALKRTKRETG